MDCHLLSCDCLEDAMSYYNTLLIISTRSFYDENNNSMNSNASIKCVGYVPYLEALQVLEV